MNMLNQTVSLKDGRKGICTGQLKSGEYILSSDKGVQISYFEDKDVLETAIKQDAILPDVTYIDVYKTNDSDIFYRTDITQNEKAFSLIVRSHGYINNLDGIKSACSPAC